MMAAPAGLGFVNVSTVCHCSPAGDPPAAISGKYRVTPAGSDAQPRATARTTNRVRFQWPISRIKSADGTENLRLQLPVVDQLHPGFFQRSPGLRRRERTELGFAPLFQTRARSSQLGAAPPGVVHELRRSRRQPPDEGGELRRA